MNCLAPVLRCEKRDPRSFGGPCNGRGRAGRACPDAFGASQALTIAGVTECRNYVMPFQSVVNPLLAGCKVLYVRGASCPHSVTPVDHLHSPEHAPARARLATTWVIFPDGCCEYGSARRREGLWVCQPAPPPVFLSIAPNPRRSRHPVPRRTASRHGVTCHLCPRRGSGVRVSRSSGCLWRVSVCRHRT